MEIVAFPIASSILHTFGDRLLESFDRSQTNNETCLTQDPSLQNLNDMYQSKFQNLKISERKIKRLFRGKAPGGRLGDRMSIDGATDCALIDVVLGMNGF